MNVRASTGIERRAADDREPQPSAEPCEHRRADHRAQHRHEQVDRAAAASWSPRDSRARRTRSNSLRLSGDVRQRLLDARMEALEDARHREHRGRRLRREVVGDLRDAAAIRHLRADARAAGSSRRCARTCATAAGSTGTRRRPRHVRSAGTARRWRGCCRATASRPWAPRRAGREADRRERVVRQIVRRPVAAGRGRKAAAVVPRFSVVRAQYDDRRQRMRGLGELARLAAMRELSTISKPRLARAPRTMRRSRRCRRRRAARRPAPCRAPPGRSRPSRRRCARTARRARRAPSLRGGTPPASGRSARHFPDGDVLPRCLR